jgi:pyrroline-5-carboxylate reductase
MHSTVAILGAGAMGEALASGLLRAGWETGEISMAVRREERRRELAERTGCAVLLDPAEALVGKEVAVVAVKPRDVPHLLYQIQGRYQPGQVILSLAAGVPTRLYEASLGEAPVVRAMPNTPALVDEGITGLAAGRYAGEEALARAERVLSAVGQVIRMEESLLDAVTAVSGTGPAYAFLLAEALTEAAIREGLPRQIAERLVNQTIKGAGALLVETGLSPFELRAQVTSPGGTTAAAVHVLEERGFRALVEDAVRAAGERSRELGARAEQNGDR